MNWRRFLSRNTKAEISAQAMEACEAIISEIGADLHDDLIQKLSVLRLHLDNVERCLSEPNEARDAVTRMQVDFQHTIDSVRQISRRLYPVHFEDDPFEKRLETLCCNFESAGTVTISTTFEGHAFEFSEGVSRHILRMAQELIHNAIRHSLAWNVWVSVKWTSSNMTLEVEDDGSGIAKISEFVGRLRRKHNSLRLRCEAIGAKISYQTGEQGLKAVIKVGKENG